MDSGWFSHPRTQQSMNEMLPTSSFHPAQYHQPSRMRQVSPNHPHPHQGYSRPSPPGYTPVVGRGQFIDHRGMRMPPSLVDPQVRSGPPSFHMQPRMHSTGPMMINQSQTSPPQMRRQGVPSSHRSDVPHHHHYPPSRVPPPGHKPDHYHSHFQQPGRMPMQSGTSQRFPTRPIPSSMCRMTSIRAPHNHMIPILGSPKHCGSRSPGPSPPPPPPFQQRSHSFAPSSSGSESNVAVAPRSIPTPLRELRSQNVPLAQATTLVPLPKTPTSLEQQQQQEPFATKPFLSDGTAAQIPSAVKFEALQDAASILLELRCSSSPPVGASEGQLSDEGSTDDAMIEKREEDDEKRDDVEDELEPPLIDVPKSFPSRLALPGDESWLNSLHCFLRAELLEVFVVEKSQSKSPTHAPGSSVGRVGLRCVHCAMARKTLAGQQHDNYSEAPMAVFYPKCIAEIYRLVTSWQRCHLRKCRSLPPDVRANWMILRETDKSRGKTQYWVTSAKQIGLVDCTSRAGGVRFAVETA